MNVALTATTRFARRGGTAQRGAFLLEALIAILIFSFGILGLIGMQAQSIRYVSDSQYRAEATYLVNSYIARMWSADPALWATQYVDPTIPGTPAEAFMQTLTQMPGGLPGAAAIANNPTITLTTGPATVGTINVGTRASLVVVTVWWLAPGEIATDVDPVNGKGHQYVATAVIGNN